MNIFKVEIKNMLKPFLIWSIILSCILAFFMSLFPSMSNSGMTELIQAKMDAMPEGIIQAFGIETIDFTDLLEYFAYASQYILIAVCVYAGILGGNSLIKEESEGTIEFLYAQPISRTKIIAIKLAASFVMIYILTIILFLVTMMFFESFKSEGYEYFMDLVMIYKGMFMVQFTFLSIGILVSTVIKKVSMATPIMLGIVFSTYMLGMFATIIEKIEWMKYLSPIHYVMPSTILNNNSNIEFSYIVICTVVSIVSIGGAFYRYKTKDFQM